MSSLLSIFTFQTFHLQFTRTDIAFGVDTTTTAQYNVGYMARRRRRDCKLGIFNTSPRRQYTNMSKQTARLFVEKHSGYIYTVNPKNPKFFAPLKNGNNIVR